jgi:hypothetical protein
MLITKFKTTSKIKSQAGQYGELFEDQTFDPFEEKAIGGSAKQFFLGSSPDLTVENQPGINYIIEEIGALFAPFYTISTNKVSQENFPPFPELENPEALIRIMTTALETKEWPDPVPLGVDVIRMWRERQRSDTKKRYSSFSALEDSRPSKKSKSRR